MLSVLVQMAPPTTSWAPAQTSPVSTQYQQVSTGVNKYQVGCLFKVPKSHIFEWLFKKNGILAVSGSDLGLVLTTSSLRQNSSWACFSSTCSLPCINPLTLAEVHFLYWKLGGKQIN